MKHLVDLALVACFAVLIAMLVLRWPVVMVSPAPPAPNPIHFVPGKYDPIAVWNDTERSLTVTTAMPREALICIRGRCRLAEEWADAK